jgi:hypothetical protein
MSFFGIAKLLEKIYDALPISNKKQKWRDDFDESSLSSDWEILQIGSGQTVNVANSELTINCGIAVGSTIIRNKRAFAIPFAFSVISKCSQRINGQNLVIEIIDESNTNYARFIYSGTGANNLNTEVSRDGTTFITGNITLDLVSSGYSILEIDATIDEIRFSTKSANSILGRMYTLIRNQRIPNANKNYYIQIRTINLFSLTSNTQFIIDSVSLQETETFSSELVGIKNNKAPGDSMSVVNPASSNISAFLSLAPSILNSQIYAAETVTPLGANAVFTGTSKTVSGRTEIIYVVDTDQPGSLYIDESFDNTNFLDFGVKPCIAGLNTFTVSSKLQYVKIRYINGSTAQTKFRIYSQFRTF